jgi:hypothetical protein
MTNDFVVPPPIPDPDSLPDWLRRSPQSFAPHPCSATWRPSGSYPQPQPEACQPRRGTHNAFMGDHLTLLSPVQKGPIWRVRITWPTGTIHHFGKFASEKDARNWITARPWLTERPTFPSHVPIRRRQHSSRSIGGDGSLTPRPLFRLRSPAGLILDRSSP